VLEQAVNKATIKKGVAIEEALVQRIPRWRMLTKPAFEATDLPLPSF